MPDPLEEPPWPEKGFTKKMYSEWLDDIWQWLRDHRIVGVTNGGFITDAQGGTGFVINLPDFSGVAAALNTWPFQGYESIFTGDGDAPPDQVFRIRIRLGTVNVPPPTNLSEEFIMPASAVTWVYVTGTFDGTSGLLLSSIIGQGESVPADPTPPVDGGAATTGSRGLFRVTTDAHGIKKDENGDPMIEPVCKTSITVNPVPISMQCGTNTYTQQWIMGAVTIS